MALTKAQLVDLIMEERQITVKLEKMGELREARKALIQQTAADALTQADTDYTTATQAAQSRLAVISTTLKTQGAWGEP